MRWPEDNQAYTMAITYGLLPPKKIHRKGSSQMDHGKYEPDRLLAAESRTMVLASFFDKTNILVRYTPEDLP